MTINNISFSYGDKKVLSNFSCNIETGKINTLEGPSGCGKTTLLRLISHLEFQTQGSVDTAFTNNCAFMFQENRLLEGLTVLEQIECISSTELAKKWLSAVSLGEVMNSLCSELSGGMLRRLALARCLAFAEANEKDVLLLDEPFTGVNKELIDSIMPQIKKTGRTVIMSAHDSESLSYSENRIIIA